MSLKINKERSNIDEDDDFIGNWKVQPDEELTKFMAKQIQDAINIEIMKHYFDPAICIDSKPLDGMIDTYNHPMYRPVVTVKFNEDKQIVLEYENR